MYRLFMSDPGFHADLEVDSRYLWLHWCNDVGALDVVLQTQLLSFETRPAEFRFEIASRVRSLSASAFIRCIGLDPSEPKLATLQSRKGLTVMHYVASRLHQLAKVNDAAHDEELRSWVSIGVSVLQNGAQPCAIADIENDNWLSHGDSQLASTRYNYEDLTKVTRTTPLLICVGHPDWQIRTAGSVESVDNFREISRALRVWVEMVQNAGLDLKNYGSEELEAWKSLPDFESYLRPKEIADPCLWPLPRITQLVYGPRPADWTFKTFHALRVDIYQLKRTPGDFPDSQLRPRTIMWRPTHEEDQEGVWEFTKRHNLLTRHIEIGESLDITESGANFRELLESSQDDTGPVSLMQGRASHPRFPTSMPRSCSQPPSLRRREWEHYSAYQPMGRLWMGKCHLCPLDFHWKFHSDVGDYQVFVGNEVLNGNLPVYSLDARSCICGKFPQYTSLQQSWFWEKWSFLSDIASCQDGEAGNLSLRRSGHSFDRDCPWGCGKVHLDRMHVPESVLHFHPRRKYGDLEE